MHKCTADKEPTLPVPTLRGMNLQTVQVRGVTHWCLVTWSAGRRKRQYFSDEGRAQRALDDARKQQAAVGKAFDVLPARDKARLMGTLAEIERAGMTLEGVWKAVRSLPNALRASCTLGNAITEVLLAKEESKCRPRHVGNLKWYLGVFAKGRESMDVRSITAEILEDWFKARGELPRSKKGHISLLSCLFAHCCRKGYMADNPARRLDPVHIDRGLPAVLTLAQSRRAILWARRQKPKSLAWLALTLFAGLRPDSEADCIDWKDIDLDKRRIVITKSKVRSPRIIDLEFCPPALAWLEVAKALKSPLPIAHVTRRRYVRDLRAFLKFKRWPQDILRHTAASNLLAFHQDAGKVAAFLGNSAGVLLRDYKALIFKEDAQKFLAMLPKQRHFKALSADVIRKNEIEKARSKRWPGAVAPEKAINVKLAYY